MSYDIRLVDAQGKQLFAQQPHGLTGGTYCLGDTRELWLNVTYNYGSHFRRLFGPEGIRWLYGKTGRETVSPLHAAAAALRADADPADYWKPTEGNARQALADLAILAELCPDGIWSGD